ncbi:MAG: protein kinase [Planctomycetes bacterium]|nr:protein kinase [Planctomycetota bacterium]
MNDDTWERAKNLFHDLLEFPTEERRERLVDLCPDDGAVRAEVLELLEGHEEVGPEEPSPERPNEGPGTRIGRYKLLEPIGEGGFGLVYMAEQLEPLRRKVALKVIKLGMDTKQVIARFEAERQALAVLEHPNIARVYDAGSTEQGRPYFVMELVRGIPITEYCDRASLSTRDRLALFVPVCQAIQHAHHKGIIHRDLKPSNVLVTLHDGRPVPKVIDFGIAKATHARLTEKTLFTEFRQVIGTPEYMAPEQAEMSGLDVDTRADVYSLGVLLYELLTGTKPFCRNDLFAQGYEAMLRIIREVDPPRPSTRVSTLGLEATTIAQQRNTQASRLGHLLRGDLDWIVMKALEKDRRRRYETADEFARDVERHLQNEPVLAGPPGTGYRLRKFAIRHKLTFTVGTLVLVGLVTGLAVASHGWNAARTARDAEAAARTSEREQRMAAEDAEGEARLQRDRAIEERERADSQSERLRHSLYVSTIRRAQLGLVTKVDENPHDLLETCDADLRGWEWNRLKWLADRSVRTLDTSELEGMRHVEHSPDGSRILVAGPHLALVLEGPSWKEVFRAVPSEGKLAAAAWHPGGEHIATCTHAGDLVVNHVNGSDEPVRHSIAAMRNVNAIAFSPNGTHVALAGNQETRLVAWRQGVVTVASNMTNRGSCVAFSPDGALLAVGTNTNLVVVVRVADGMVLWHDRGASHVVANLAISPDGRYVATVGQEGTLWVHELATGRLAFLHSMDQESLGALTFHPDGRHVAIAGSQGFIELCEMEHGSVRTKFGASRGAVKGLSFHPSGQTLLAATQEDVKEWDIGMGENVLSIGHPSPLTQVAFGSSGEDVLVGGHHSGLLSWSLRTIAPTVRLDPNMPCGGIAVDSSGRWIAVVEVHADDSTSVHVVGNGGSETRTLGRGHVQRHAFHERGSHLIVSRDDQMAVVNTSNWETEQEIAGRGRAVFGRGDELFVGREDGTLERWTLGREQPVESVRVGTRAIDRLEISANGEVLAVRDGDGHLSLRTTATLERLMETRIEGQASPFALHPSGRRLALRRDRNRLVLLDTETATELMTIGHHTGRINAIAFSQDGTTLASADEGHALQIWETAPPREGFESRRLAMSRPWRLDAEARRSRWLVELGGIVPQVKANPWAPSLLDRFARILIADDLGDLRNTREARLAAERAVQLTHGENPLFRVTLAHAIFHGGDAREAANILREVLATLPPELASARDFLRSRLARYEDSSP